MNNKAQVSLTKTGILFVVIIFYSSIFLLIGLLNSFMNTSVTANQQGTDIIEQPSFSFLGINISSFGFLGMMISGISEIPIAINIILFGSLITIVTWIIVSSLPTMSGGS